MRKRIVFQFFSYPTRDNSEEGKRRKKSHWRDIVLDRLVAHFAHKYPETDIEVVGTNDEIRLDEERLEGRLHYYLPNIPVRILSLLLFIITSFLHLVKLRPSLVYSYSYGHTAPSIGALLYCKLAKVPFFIDFKNPPASLVLEPVSRFSNKKRLVFGLADRMVFRFSDKIVHTNLRSKSLLEDCPAPYKKSVVSENFAESIWSESKAVVRSRPQGTRFAYWGIMDIERELDIAIRGFSNALNGSGEMETKLYLVGDGNAVPQLRSLANELNVSENVIFLDYMPQERLVDFLKGVDVAVVPIPPHRFYHYSSPVKLAEAISLELPILASDINPNSAVREHGLGIVCKHDEREYEQAFLSFMSYETLRPFSENCGKVKYLFSPEYTLRELDIAFQSALESKAG